MFFDNLKKVFKKPDEKREEEIRNKIEEHGGLEKKDLPAMIISSYLVILPIAFGILLLFALVAFLFVRQC